MSLVLMLDLTQLVEVEYISSEKILRHQSMSALLEIYSPNFVVDREHHKLQNLIIFQKLTHSEKIKC